MTPEQADLLIKAIEYVASCLKGIDITIMAIGLLFFFFKSMSSD